MRAFLGNLALSIVSLALCGAVGEVALRLFAFDHQLEFELDDELYWRFRPNQRGFVWMGNASFRSPEGRINNLGTRGPDVGPQRNGKRCILLLGDSYTFGSGVRDEETFGAVLGAALGDEVEVINAGIPGYGIFQDERLLRRLGPLLRPQLVIVTIPTGDILRQPFATPEQEHAYLDAERRRLRWRDLSALATFLYRRYYSLRARFADEGVAVPNEQSSSGGRRFGALWERDQQRLLDMAGLCRRWGGRLVVVAWPQNNQPDWDRSIVEGVRRLSENDGIISLVELDQALSGHPQDELRIPRDGHPSAAAHAAAGRYLAATMKEFVSQ